jgi:transposase
VPEWVKQAERDAGTRDDGGLRGAEKAELAAMRRESKWLRENVETLKRPRPFREADPGERASGHRGGEHRQWQRQVCL